MIGLREWLDQISQGMQHLAKGEMTILPINDKYRLAADRFTWMIQQARKRKGQIVWVAINWFPSLEMAVNALGNLMVRTSDAKTVDEVLREAKKVTDTMV